MSLAQTVEWAIMHSMLWVAAGFLTVRARAAAPLGLRSLQENAETFNQLVESIRSAKIDKSRIHEYPPPPPALHPLGPACIASHRIFVAALADGDVTDLRWSPVLSCISLCCVVTSHGTCHAVTGMLPVL